jgi:hypothetical protein
LTQLAHADRNKVGSAYNYAKYLPQRRTMIQGWADHLDKLRVQTEVALYHQIGQQAALDAMNAFTRGDDEGATSFQAQAMAALQAIMSLSKRH